jgi:hypothetical protein
MAGPRRVGAPGRLIIWRSRHANNLAFLKMNILLVLLFHFALPGAGLH